MVDFRDGDGEGLAGGTAGGHPVFVVEGGVAG